MNYFSINKVFVPDTQLYAVNVVCSGCDSFCLFCRAENVKSFDTGTPLTDKDIRNVVKMLSSQNCVGLEVCGGEPLDSRNINGVIKLCHWVKESLPWQHVTVYTHRKMNPNTIGRKARNDPDASQETLDAGILIKYVDTFVTRTCYMSEMPAHRFGTKKFVRSITWVKETESKWKRT